MTWQLVGPRGARSDLWVAASGPGKPDRGRWKTPMGLDVYKTLRTAGPAGLDIEIFWAQAPETRGTDVTDLLWQTHRSGLKLGTARLADILRSHCPDIKVFPVRVRTGDGAEVENIVGLLEPSDEPAAVHSLYRGRRGSRFVVSGDVADALREAGLTGLDFEDVTGPFPGDDPSWATD